ncbi:MAG: Na+/H+ antiporter subunit E [Gammaproteobacteria bacterium]
MVFVYAILFLLWVLLTGSMAVDELYVGAIVALVVTAVSRPHLGVFAAVRLTPSAPMHLLAYLGYFLIALIKANFDLAARVLSPSLPIEPRLVTLQTDLESPLGRMLLANSITLTPGTLTVDVSGRELLIHFVYSPENEAHYQLQDKVVAGFERHIRGFLK